MAFEKNVAIYNVMWIRKQNTITNKILKWGSER